MTQPRKLFVNIPVKDLAASIEFFTRLGFEFDPRFTDETATCMLVNEDAYFMLLTEARFGDFTTKRLVDATAQTEAIFALTADSREAVDALVAEALAAGGKPSGDTNDHGFMYQSGFQDLDGHMWEVFWMDPATVAQ